MRIMWKKRCELLESTSKCWRRCSWSVGEGARKEKTANKRRRAPETAEMAGIRRAWLWWRRRWNAVTPMGIAWGASSAEPPHPPHSLSLYMWENGGFLERERKRREQYRICGGLVQLKQQRFCDNDNPIPSFVSHSTAQPCKLFSSFLSHQIYLTESAWTHSLCLGIIYAI